MSVNWRLINAINLKLPQNFEQQREELITFEFWSVASSKVDLSLLRHNVSYFYLWILTYSSIFLPMDLHVFIHPYFYPWTLMHSSILQPMDLLCWYYFCKAPISPVRANLLIPRSIQDYFWKLQLIVFKRVVIELQVNFT